VHHSHCFLDDFLAIWLCRCLILGKAKEYSCVIKALKPMTLFIPSEGTVAALR